MKATLPTRRRNVVSPQARGALFVDRRRGQSFASSWGDLLFMYLSAAAARPRSPRAKPSTSANTNPLASAFKQESGGQAMETGQRVPGWRAMPPDHAWPRHANKSVYAASYCNSQETLPRALCGRREAFKFKRPRRGLSASNTVCRQPQDSQHLHKCVTSDGQCAPHVMLNARAPQTDNSGRMGGSSPAPLRTPRRLGTQSEKRAPGSTPTPCCWWNSPSTFRNAR